MDMNSLSHTKWECKYHIVFAPKYRRKVAYGQLKADIANILSTLCKRKGVEIIEAEIAQLQSTLDMLKYKCWYYETAIKDGNEDGIKAMLPNNLPPEIQKLYDSGNGHKA